jgi:hypothetical protein
MKKVLVITYYWPPAGGPGVQRWLHFVRYFREFGIEPVVYVPENAHYPLLDESLSTLVPTDVTVISQSVKEPYGWAKTFFKKKTKQLSSGILTSKKPSLLEKAMLFIRGNFFIPDARVGWVTPSIKFLQNYILQHPFDAVVTTGPPHSVHLIGLGLAQSLQLPWLADFRDPWTNIHYHSQLRLTKASNKKHRDLERKVLNAASTITVTSPSTKEEFSQITNQPIQVVTNGFEPYAHKTALSHERFRISHVGSLLSDRNPKILWQTLAKLVNEYPHFAQAFELQLTGAVSQEILDDIEKAGLLDYLTLEDYVPHKEAVRRQREASVLLLVEMDKPETRAIIPGKLFEYFSAGRPILALGPSDSDVAQLLKETGAGSYFLYNEAAKLEEQLIRYFTQFREGTLVTETSSVAHFTRRNLTEKMASVIKKMV